jgi:Fe-S-cluster containining protein
MNRHTGTMSEIVRQRVGAVYAQVEAAIAAAQPRCTASGRCCRFSEYGHTLFLSHFEAEILLEAAPEYPRPVTRESCPFQVNGLCTVRSIRPLGCRIYFCDADYQKQMGEIAEQAVAALKQIANEFGTGWQYAPLHDFLNAAPTRSTGTAPDSMTTPAARVALPVVAAGAVGEFPARSSLLELTHAATGASGIVDARLQSDSPSR